MKLQQAEQIAKWIKAALEPHCERIEIAGSIRRKKPDVGDMICALRGALGISETIVITRAALKRHLKPGAYRHKGYAVYQMNDCDWWASRKKTQSAVLEEYLAFVGDDELLREESEELRALSLADLLSTIFNDEDGCRRTFMDELEQVADKQDGKGFFFASTEC